MFRVRQPLATGVPASRSTLSRQVKTSRSFAPSRATSAARFQSCHRRSAPLHDTTLSSLKALSTSHLLLRVRHCISSSVHRHPSSAHLRDTFTQARSQLLPVRLASSATQRTPPLSDSGSLPLYFRDDRHLRSRGLEPAHPREGQSCKAQLQTVVEIHSPLLQMQICSNRCTLLLIFSLGVAGHEGRHALLVRGAFAASCSRHCLVLGCLAQLPHRRHLRDLVVAQCKATRP